jgi:hypothetical protein
MSSHLLTVITFLPLLGVPALLLLRADDHTWIRRIALAISVAEFVISLFLLHGFDGVNAQYQFEEYYDWIARANIHYHLGVDGISLFLVLLTTFLTPLAILCSWQAIRENVKGFFIALLVIETAMIGVFVSLDLLLFFFFWELTLIPMYFLIGIWGHDRRIYAAVKFILYTMFGSILMLVAILWLYNLAGTFDVPDIQAKLQTGLVLLPSHTELLLFGAFFLAFAIKVPLFPLHTWLPDAHTEAPTAGSVILAGVMLKLGTYGMLRFCLPLFPDAAHRMAPYIGVLAIIGIVYGAMVATVQTDLKRLVAYTSVSHLGFVVLRNFRFQHDFDSRRDFPDVEPRRFDRRAFPRRGNAVRPAAHVRDQGIRRLGESDAGADVVFSFYCAFFARVAAAQWLYRRVPDSDRDVSGPSRVGGVGCEWGRAFGDLFVMGLPARRIWRSNCREKSHFARRFGARAADSGNHGSCHYFHGRGFPHLHAAHGSFHK